MLTNRDTGLIRLAHKHGFIDEATMHDLMGQLDGESSGMAESLLIDAGLSSEQIAGLVNSQRSASIPASFDGYHVTGIIGKGGMSVVLKAVEESSKREVAIKLLSPHAEGMHNARARFQREMQAATHIVDPNLVSCYGCGETNQRPYIAMEYMAGGDLDKRMRHKGALSPAAVVRLLRDVGKGLIAVRAANLIHRDLKPANLFMDAQGTIKIADLGLSRLYDDHETLTMTGISVGTPDFMAPEQALGRYDIDFRADFFSLGSTAYTLVSGAKPFSGGSQNEIMRAVVKQPPPPLTVIAPGTPPGLALIIDCLMAKEPDRRYQCAEALVEDCQRLLDSDLAVSPSQLLRHTAPDRHGTATQRQPAAPLDPQRHQRTTEHADLKPRSGFFTRLFGWFRRAG